MTPEEKLYYKLEPEGCWHNPGVNMGPYQSDALKRGWFFDCINCDNPVRGDLRWNIDLTNPDADAMEWMMERFGEPGQSLMTLRQNYDNTWSYEIDSEGRSAIGEGPTPAVALKHALINYFDIKED